MAVHFVWSSQICGIDLAPVVLLPPEVWPIPHSAWYKHARSQYRTSRSARVGRTATVLGVAQRIGRYHSAPY
eukprot:3470160-Rhodomonas_salina.2